MIYYKVYLNDVFIREFSKKKYMMNFVRTLKWYNPDAKNHYN